MKKNKNSYKVKLAKAVSGLALVMLSAQVSASRLGVTENEIESGIINNETDNENMLSSDSDDSPLPNSNLDLIDENGEIMYMAGLDPEDFPPQSNGLGNINEEVIAGNTSDPNPVAPPLQNDCLETVNENKEEKIEIVGNGLIPNLLLKDPSNVTEHIVIRNAISISGPKDNMLSSHFKWLEISDCDEVIISNLEISGKIEITAKAKVKFVNCSFLGTNEEDSPAKNIVHCFGGGNATYENCKFNNFITKVSSVFAANSGGSTFNQCEFHIMSKAVLYANFAEGDGATFKFNGCLFDSMVNLPIIYCGKGACVDMKSCVTTNNDVNKISLFARNNGSFTVNDSILKRCDCADSKVNFNRCEIFNITARNSQITLKDVNIRDKGTNCIKLVNLCQFEGDNVNLWSNAVAPKIWSSASSVNIKDLSLHSSRLKAFDITFESGSQVLLVNPTFDNLNPQVYVIDSRISHNGNFKCKLVSGTESIVGSDEVKQKFMKNFTFRPIDDIKYNSLNLPKRDSILERRAFKLLSKSVESERSVDRNSPVQDSNYEIQAVKERSKSKVGILGTIYSKAVTLDTMDDNELNHYTLKLLRETNAPDKEVLYKIDYTKDCPICLEEDNHTMIFIPCNHSTHIDCISDFIVKGKILKCPICSKEIRKLVFFHE